MPKLMSSRTKLTDWLDTPIGTVVLTCGVVLACSSVMGIIYLISEKIGDCVAAAFKGGS